jgi:hypothetical protein
MRAADNATKCRDAADFDTPEPAGAGTPDHAATQSPRRQCFTNRYNFRFLSLALNRPPDAAGQFATCYE